MTSDLLNTPALQQELAADPALADAPHMAGLLFDAGLTHASGPLLQAYVGLQNEFLRTGQALMRTDRLHIINLLYVLKLRQEAEEIAVNPASRQDIAIAASRFARKAQSGLSPLPLPE